jgi:hypothetical protein
MDDKKHARVRDLTSVVKRLTTSSDLEQEWSDGEAKVVAAAREALGFAPEYGGPIAALILQEQLAEELAGLAIAEGGSLPRDALRWIDHVFEGRQGTIPSDVHAGIHDAEIEQHLGSIPERWRSALGHAKSVALFVRHLPDYVLVTVCGRAGARLRVLGSWRLYRNAVDVTKATTPSDVFDRFLDTYTAASPPPPPNHADWQPFGHRWINVAAYNQALVDHGVQS